MIYKNCRACGCKLCDDETFGVYGVWCYKCWHRIGKIIETEEKDE